MRKVRLILLLGLAMNGIAFGGAYASETPRPDRDDSRMRQIAYDPEQVVHLSTIIGGTFVVTFAPTETVVQVASTDSLHLPAIPYKNYLFFKPTAALPLQPVIVLTARADGSLRRYVFEIQTVDASSMSENTPGVYFSIDFTYPGDDAAAAAAAATVEAQKVAALNDVAQKKAQETAATDILDQQRTNPFVGPRNYHYDARGNASLAPISIWDNGYSTAMKFPGNARLPSVFVKNPDGAEAMTDYTIIGSTIQINETAKEFILRDGKTALEIYNRGYNSTGMNPGTGTTSPVVLRVINSSSVSP